MATSFHRSRPAARPHLEPLETRHLLSGQALVAGTLVRTPAQDYVAHVSEDVLHRPADAAGLAYWSAQLDRGVSPAAVVQGILESPECAAQAVQECYQQCLGRPADPAGMAWLGGLAARNPVLAQAELYGSAEYFFTRGGGSDAGFVQALYEDALGRPPDAAGAAHYAARLAGGQSRAAVARELLGSDEACQRMVTDLFAACLHRTPDAGGLAYYTAALHAGATVQDVRAALLASTECWGAVQAPGDDAVMVWNELLLDAVRAGRTVPPRSSRELAILNAALADAVGPLRGTGGFYLASAPVPAGASAEAAAAAAGYTVLASLYPARQALFAAARDAMLAATPGGRARADGVAFGQAAARAVLAARAHDGSDQDPPYTPGSGPGAWVPTPPAYAPALLPGWGSVTPFTMTSGSQFRPPAPPALDSAAYAADVAEVRSLGSATSSTRTADQTAIATFWADGSGTFTPPGHWIDIARTVALARHTTLAETARLFGAVGLALADAGIIAWDAKYTYNLWRPVTALNPGLQPGDPGFWTPLLTTPPFSSYVSGHSTFSGAAETVLTAFFPGPVSFTSTADNGSGAVRSYASFRQAADEAGRSRIYGGLHYEFDNQPGLSSGRALGAWVAARYVP